MLAGTREKGFEKQNGTWYPQVLILDYFEALTLVLSLIQQPTV